MKPLTQALMILLAIAFAVALSLTVALLCLSYAQGLPHESVDTGGGRLPGQTDTRLPPLYETDPPAILPPIDSSPTESEEESEEETEPETLLPDVSNGLSFVSNRNGTCRVFGIGTCIDACVVIPEYAPSGERVVSVDSGAFFGCSTVTAIQIPASVVEIGDLAFSACKNLMYISVNAQNAHYRDIDGILYSKDAATLILYPPMRAGSELTIYTVTTEIAEMAFYNCAYLRAIYYTGSPEQWESISVGSKNYSLIAAAKVFYANGK
ncbi:MAG: leucine-rich repeat protein [Clostridia bacterium]|nr:leucine-rich repeat protein [Clostridia bacterium]